MTNDFTNPIISAHNTLTSRLARAMDEKLKEMFGSEESFRDLARYFVLEDYGIEFSTDYDMDFNGHTLRIDQRFRLRHKTLDEWAAEEQSWKTIPLFPEYAINRAGQVKLLSTDTLVEPDESGLVVTLYANDLTRVRSIQYLKYLTFKDD